MSYKRIVITKFGGPEVLKLIEESTLPEPGAGEVRVKVLATSAAFTDTMIRKGKYPEIRKKPPFSPGYDMIGLVDKLGQGVTHLSAGQLVADLTVIGAYSEYICLGATALVPVPDGLDLAEAVSLILTYITAYQMLHHSAKIEAGQRILVHGAGGAVGSAILQLGQLLDLEMYGTASESKQQLISSLGATAINYKSEDFVERIRNLTGDGVDAVFDAIGGDYFKRSFQSLRAGGTLVGYGFYNVATGQGGLPTILWGLLQMKLWDIWPNGKSTAFYSITSYRKKQPATFSQDLTTLFELLAQAKIKPVIDKRLPLSEAAQAHALLDQAAVAGKIVLIPAHNPA